MLLREFRTDGTCSELALATAQEFDDPVKVWNGYRLRVSIEERHRRMKCFRDLTHFRSQAYSLVANQVIFMVLAYSLMQCFLLKCEREEFTGTTRRRLLDQLLPAGQKVCVYRDNCVGYFTPLELMSEVDTDRRLSPPSCRPPELGGGAPAADRGMTEEAVG